MRARAGEKLRVFLGSSTEAKRHLEVVSSQLKAEFELQIWHENVFSPGGNTYTSLIERIKTCDFTVLVLSADDMASIRSNDYFVPRDNLIFEAGISFGMLAPERTFIIPEKIDPLRIPTDIAGFTVCEGFERKTPDPGLMAASRQVKRRMHQLGRRRGSLSGETKESLIARTNALLRTASRSITMVGRDLSWVNDYRSEIENAIKRNVRVKMYGEMPKSANWKRRIEDLKSMDVEVRCSSADLGFRFTIVDHEDIGLSEFIICSKERHGDGLVYRFEHHAYAGAPVLWNTLNRLIGIYPNLSSPV